MHMKMKYGLPDRKKKGTSPPMVCTLTTRPCRVFTIKSFSEIKAAAKSSMYRNKKFHTIAEKNPTMMHHAKNTTTWGFFSKLETSLKMLGETSVWTHCNRWVENKCNDKRAYGGLEKAELLCTSCFHSNSSFRDAR